MLSLKQYLQLDEGNEVQQPVLAQIQQFFTSNDLELTARQL